MEENSVNSPPNIGLHTPSTPVLMSSFRNKKTVVDLSAKELLEMELGESQFEFLKRLIMAVKSDTQEVKTFANFTSDKLDVFLKKIEFQGDVIQKLNKRVTDLQTENVELRENMRAFRQDLNEISQYSRSLNLEISGVPEEPQENLEVMVQNLAKKIGTNPLIFGSDIEALHRVPTLSKVRPKSIIIRFSSRKTRNSWLLAKKAMESGLKASDLNPDFRDLDIFLNEHLIPQTKHLLYLTKKKRDELKFKFAWVKDGKVFLRKDNNSRILRIRDVGDLEVLVPHHTDDQDN